MQTTKENGSSKSKRLHFKDIVNQAKESLKFVENLATSIPALKNSKELTNQKILSSLKSLGVATRQDVEALEKRVETLESEIKKLNASRTAKPAGPKVRADDEAAE